MLPGDQVDPCVAIAPPDADVALVADFEDVVAAILAGAVLWHCGLIAQDDAVAAATRSAELVECRADNDVGRDIGHRCADRHKLSGLPRYEPVAAIRLLRRALCAAGPVAAIVREAFLEHWRTGRRGGSRDRFGRQCRLGWRGRR